MNLVMNLDIIKEYIGNFKKSKNYQSMKPDN